MLLSPRCLCSTMTLTLLLVVDSLKPTEIIISFTSFSKWLDPLQLTHSVPVISASNPSHINVAKTGKDSKEPKTPDRPPGTAEPPSGVGSVVGGEGGLFIDQLTV